MVKPVYHIVPEVSQTRGFSPPERKKIYIAIVRTSSSICLPCVGHGTQWRAQSHTWSLQLRARGIIHPKLSWHSSHEWLTPNAAYMTCYLLCVKTVMDYGVSHHFNQAYCDIFYTNVTYMFCFMYIVLNLFNCEVARLYHIIFKSYVHEANVR